LGLALIVGDFCLELRVPSPTWPALNAKSEHHPQNLVLHHHQPEPVSSGSRFIFTLIPLLQNVTMQFPGRSWVLTLVGILFLLIIVNDSVVTQLSQIAPSPSVNRAVQAEHDGLRTLFNSSFGAFDPAKKRWLNLSGLRGDEGFEWGALDQVRARAKHQYDEVIESLGLHRPGGESEEALPTAIPVYHNVSGYSAGRWIASDISISKPALNQSIVRSIDRSRANMTSHGDVAFHLYDSGEADVFNGIMIRGLRVEMSILDDNDPAGKRWDLVLYGEHLVESGSIILATTSYK
jgi:hypothetical protein